MTGESSGAYPNRSIPCAAEPRIDHGVVPAFSPGRSPGNAVATQIDPGAGRRRLPGCPSWQPCRERSQVSTALDEFRLWSAATSGSVLASIVRVQPYVRLNELYWHRMHRLGSTPHCSASHSDPPDRTFPGVSWPFDARNKE